jgi:hypothetical protein
MDMDVRLLTNATNTPLNNAALQAARNNPLPTDLANRNTDGFESTRTWRGRDADDRQSLAALIDQSNRQTEAFRQMIERLLLNQSGTSQIANGDLMIQIDEATRLRAQEAIGEDGYFGVEQTSERLLAFAVAFAGDDPERLAVMRDAVLRGFEAARNVWGGELPEISHRTLDAVMQGFDRLMGISPEAE